MLPRKDVEEFASCSMGKRDSIYKRTGDACKHALRPKPPNVHVMHWLRDRGNLGDYKAAVDWIEWVLEHGWEVG